MAIDLREVDQPLVTRAVDGDARAMSEIVRALEKTIYGVASRMLFNRGDAEDATQEALLRIVTRLAQFRGESAFSTWAYRIAVRRILDFREQLAAAARITEEAFAADLADGLDSEAPDRTEDAILHQQLKVICSHAMLRILDRDHRIAFVLGEIIGLSSGEAAEILEIEPPTFRKRQSRARAKLTAFLGRHCGVVNDAAPCRCHRRLDRAIALGRVSPDRLEVDRGGIAELRRQLSTISEMQRVTAFYRDEPALKSKRDFVASIRSLVEGQP